MLSLYEILKASKTGIVPDMWTALAGKNWGGADSGAEVKELTGIPPLSFTADGTSLLDYLISGNMSQASGVSPTTPIQPQECGERTGNLFDKNNVTDRTDLSASTGNLVYGRTKCVSDYIEIAENTSYTTHNVTTYALYDNSKNYLFGLNIETGGIRDVTIDNINAKYMRIACEMDDKSTVMLNTGSTALPYEPYGIKIPILSANTTTPVYLGEVQTTRKIKKLVLTGEEIILRDREREGSWRFFTDKLISAKDSTGICSHFENIGTNGVNNSDNIGFSIFNNAQFGCRCPKSLADTVTDFKAYLAAQYAAGTPVTAWYVLKTPETGIVNEPLRKIGDYADTISYEQAGVQIPTNRGNTVIDVETTLKPSEMYIKYQE